jgi:hypothetical protein
MGHPAGTVRTCAGHSLLEFYRDHAKLSARQALVIFAGHNHPPKVRSRPVNIHPPLRVGFTLHATALRMLVRPGKPLARLPV